MNIALDVRHVRHLLLFDLSHSAVILPTCYGLGTSYGHYPKQRADYTGVVRLVAISDG
jgi:hypothetical protein